MSRGTLLTAVILTVPDAADTLSPRERVAFLSRHARKALQRSAIESGLPFVVALKDRHGRPLPDNGTYWSVTHKPAYVGGIVAPFPIGIDIERVVGRRTDALFDKVADAEEWNLMGRRTWEGFHRLWTAKEAALKADGTGLRGLSGCRVTAVPTARSLIVWSEQRQMIVDHCFFDGHIASVAKTSGRVRWIRPDHPLERCDRDGH
jgi:4'-phosphopantetheinyl transferase